MEKPGRMLLHVCCGPCATSSIERLLNDGWKVDLFYSNSNIYPRVEYEKRLEGVKKTAEYFGIEWFADDYSHEDWLEAVRGYENEPEKGRRCARCFGYSLSRTAERAGAGGYSGFCTTLTVSPHKISKVLFSEGHSAAAAVEDENCRYIEYDFKKKDGYKRSIELAKEIGLYRQNYCGCEFSMRG